MYAICILRCILIVSYMHPICILYASYVYPMCILYVSYMYYICILYAFWNVYYMYLICIRYVFLHVSLYVSLYAFLLFTPCDESLCTRLTSTSMSNVKHSRSMASWKGSQRSFHGLGQHPIQVLGLVLYPSGHSIVSKVKAFVEGRVEPAMHWFAGCRQGVDA